MKTIKILEKIMEMHKIFKIIVFRMYKILNISAETYAKNSILKIIDKEKMLWLRNKDMGEKLGVKSIYDLIDKKIKRRYKSRNLTNEQNRENKRYGSELFDGEKFMQTHENIIMSTIMHCRVSTIEAIEFKTRLRFNQHDLIMRKEQSVLTTIRKVFANEEILLQHSVLR